MLIAATTGEEADIERVTAQMERALRRAEHLARRTNKVPYPTVIQLKVDIRPGGTHHGALKKKKAVEAFMTFSEVALKRRRSRAQMSGADFGGDQCTSWQYSSPASSGS